MHKEYTTYGVRSKDLIIDYMYTYHSLIARKMARLTLGL